MRGEGGRPIFLPCYARGRKTSGKEGTHLPLRRKEKGGLLPFFFMPSSAVRVQETSEKKKEEGEINLLPINLPDRKEEGRVPKPYISIIDGITIGGRSYPTERREKKNTTDYDKIYYIF